MTQNDGKIHLLLRVEILSLTVSFSTLLLIQSTLKPESHEASLQATSNSSKY